MCDIQENPFEFLPEHGVPNIAENPAYTFIRQDLEELLMQQRIENDDPYAFLGDRTLLRFEDGIAGPLTIGAHFNSSGNVDSAFDGLIDEVSITDGFLPLNELQPLLAVAPAAPFEITGLQLSADNTTIDLSFSSSDTRLYTIQGSTTLAPGS